MRILLLAACVAMPAAVPAQNVAAPSTDASLQQSLTGDWVGVLEYRDYSEPATSSKRVDLPTWLTIAAAGKSMTWTYTYDDGPNKILEETDTVTFDPASESYAEGSAGKPASVYTADGYKTLKEGHGVLVLHGTGTDNDKPSETRTTMTIRRNLLEVIEEVRAARSSDPFVFRHMYRFTRAVRPTATGTHH